MLKPKIPCKSATGPKNTWQTRHTPAGVTAFESMPPMKIKPNENENTKLHLHSRIINQVFPKAMKFLSREHPNLSKMDR
jgi:hypothetical protein